MTSRSLFAVVFIFLASGSRATNQPCPCVGSCAYSFNDPQVPNFALPPPWATNAILNPDNPIVLANGSAIQYGCQATETAYLNDDLEWATRMAHSSGVMMPIDTFFASGSDRLYTRGIQPWAHETYAAHIRGRLLRTDLVCNNGQAGCIYFTVDAEDFECPCPITTITTTPTVAPPVSTSEFGAFPDSTLDREEFLELLGKMIGHSEQVQNNPPEQIPREDFVADEVVEYLKEWTKSEENPEGPLEVRKVAYVEGRSNVVIKYQGTDPQKVVSFVGSHMDVVPADPATWETDPFNLTVESTPEGTILWGRGVTDCMGHVALTCNLLKQLAIERPTMESSLVVIFIANEENSIFAGVGIDELERQGELAPLINGPLFWVDSADFGPTLGTGAFLGWDLKAEGKLFHSGFPHLAINAISLANEAVRALQEWFHAKYFATENEETYLFATGSTLKPTQISVPRGGLNQIPGECTVSGDIRMTPFHDIFEVQADVVRFIEELNVTSLPTFGYSKFELPDEGLIGKVSIEFRPNPLEGLAVDIGSPGYQALFEATQEVRGKAEPFSLLGSLPIIGGLKRSGFDVQVTGFGRLSAYHANNEYGVLEEFEEGYRILANLLVSLA